ncbi:hypothetical protein Tco_1341332, partial [Tanacetum coccineum]
VSSSILVQTTLRWPRQPSEKRVLPGLSLCGVALEVVLHKNALSVKVIKVLHGQECGFDNNGCIYNGVVARVSDSGKILQQEILLFILDIIGYTDWRVGKIVLLLTALIMTNDVGIGRGLTMELEILLIYSTCFLKFVL